MHRWLSAAGDAAAGYAPYGGYWVVAGAPVCAEERLLAAARELDLAARVAGARVVYFGAGERLERLLTADSHRLLLGALPVWSAQEWPHTVRRKASLRAQLHRARNKGVRVAEWTARDAESHAGQLRRVLAHWLATRGLPPLHFMTEPDTLGDLRDRRIFVARTSDGEIIAFLVAVPIPARDGWLVEQWPRMPHAPNGTTQLLVDAAMRAFRRSGSDFVTLGLAPLSDRAGTIGAGEPAWLRLLLHWMRAHGRRFYNFRGLDAFKASLAPARWEPIYAIVSGGRVSPGVLRAVAGVFGGGSPALLIARALRMAARRELVALKEKATGKRRSSTLP